MKLKVFFQKSIKTAEMLAATEKSLFVIEKDSSRGNFYIRKKIFDFILKKMEKEN